MNEERQQVITSPHPIHALSEIISLLRIWTYLQAAGHDADRALALYLWNAKMGEAFHLPIQAFEVGLRNRVFDGIAAVFGNDWWKDNEFLVAVGGKRQRDLDSVLRRLNSKGVKLDTGQLVAGLSFGFWIAMLHGRYNRAIWSSELPKAFPHLPADVNRQKLHRRATEIADFRNRISHHEPIFKRNLSGDYGKCIEAVKWLCPTKSTWIKPHCRVSAMIREKP
jgi:hypothetical protein